MKQNILKDKSKSFAIRILRLFLFLGDTKHEYVMRKQLLKSGTSIGANIAESCYAQSEADFVSKLSIALKEASETEYWLEILHETEYLSDKEYDAINDDCVELIKLLISSINTKKNKIKDKKEDVQRSNP